MKAHVLLAGLAVLGASAAAASDLETLLRPPESRRERVDVHGRTVGPEVLRDRLAVVSFVSAGCTILCVTRTMDLDKLARGLPAALRDRVVFLAIDTDPATDDGPRLRAFAEDLLGPSPRQRVLPSDGEEVRALAARLRYPASALPEPPPTILLYDRRGGLAMTYGGDPLDAPRLQRDIALLDTFEKGLDPAR
jgi:protein SCO1